jgi:hypothetical protein
MFADACEKAMKYTRPVIFSFRSVDGSTESGCAAFVILNREGWIVTAGHIFDSFIKFTNDQKNYKELMAENNKPHMMDFQPIHPDPSWITNHSFWWGWDGLRLSDAYINREMDIAVGRLDGFRPEMISEYPVLKDPAKMRPGTSLCRIGFPFLENLTDFDESTQNFRIKKGVFPMALFPNDCMYTRNVLTGTSHDSNYEMLYVETSTPGLRGQSGGPIFDRNGCVAAIQVRTAHLPLGFSPSIKNDKGEMVEEHQFLNVGIGLHVKTIMSVLNGRGIKYNCESEDKGFRIVEE